MRVSQILCAAGPVDAVTNQGLACRALFQSWGWDGDDYAAAIAPGMGRRSVRHLHEYEPGRDDVVLLHYSGYARGLEQLFEQGGPSLLISHNITPAEYFWAYEPVEGARCELARGQLASLARAVGALAGVSAFNAGELHEMSGREADVIPVLFDRSALGPPGGRDAPDTAAPDTAAPDTAPPDTAPPDTAPPDTVPLAPPTILFVGRLAPHKRQDLVIRAFARLLAHEPGARLVLVGTPLSPEFGAGLRRLADELAPGAVVFEEGISRKRLAAIYRGAHAFLCLSEHEGFCIPLLEAFHFGVPVVARDAGAIGEVLGDAGVLVSERDSLSTVAEALRIVIRDAELQDVLRQRGELRLQEYDLGRTAARLRGKLETLGAR